MSMFIFFVIFSRFSVSLDLRYSPNFFAHFSFVLLFDEMNRFFLLKFNFVRRREAVDFFSFQLIVKRNTQRVLKPNDPVRLAYVSRYTDFDASQTDNQLLSHQCNFRHLQFLQFHSSPSILSSFACCLIRTHSLLVLRHFTLKRIHNSRHQHNVEFST